MTDNNAQPDKKMMDILDKTQARLSSKEPTSMNDPAQPASEEVPEEIAKWIRDFKYLTPIHPACHEMSKQDLWDEALGNAAEAMYRHIASLLHAKDSAISQRDHDFAKLNQIVIDRDKEIEGLRDRLSEKMEAAMDYYARMIETARALRKEMAEHMQLKIQIADLWEGAGRSS